MTNTEFEARWAKIMARVGALPLVAARYGLIGNWGDIPDIVVTIKPPATAAEILAVEATLRRPIPESLKQVFLLGCRSFEIMWSWPGEFVVTPGGWGEVKLRDFPPAPSLGSGYISWGLDQLINSHEDWRGWMDELPKGNADDVSPDQARDLIQRDQLWQRSFPVTNARNGDVFALDLQCLREEMVLLNHDMDEPAGWQMRRTFLEWLEHASRLGFMSVDLGLFAKFCAPSIDAGVDEVVLDADSAAGVAWRDVFWRGLPPELHAGNA